ncbi:MAG: hypothetical protein FI707_05030 [SAR202 cluster bacterium]|jgi:hypothetical protein|nr:hypothetical protein [Chloroflexota bacterium]MDP6420879.1 hypothetical protein [SAR202 cluster bacterium]HAL46681.1 hypothetical protein [Dehalococcoidia bacterium]MDP6663805.1 hypothetical protein [SAR202 cluster bacterium]MDP6800560.1 hypothetical protein [SAR202 cluster bacterium]
MSKLVDLLRRMNQRSPQSMGFGAVTGRADTPPAIVLVGLVSDADLAKKPKLAEAGVSAILVDSEGAALSDAAAKALEGKLWGAGLAGFDEAGIDALDEQGCDFVVYDPATTSSSVIDMDDLGSFIVVSKDLDRDTARGIAGIDTSGAFLLADVVGKPVTVLGLMELQKVRGLVEGPFIATAPDSPATSDLTALSHMGVAGLVVGLGEAKAIKRLNAGIQKVRPKRAGAGASGRTALAPATPAEEEE